MRHNILISLIFVGALGLSGAAFAVASTGGAGGGGGGAHGGGASHPSSARGGTAAHASPEIGSQLTSISPGSREASALSRLGFVDAHPETIAGHHTVVAVFQHAALTDRDRELLHRYHFKGFNQCIGRGACEEASQHGQMFCRRARNVAITSDWECLDFRPKD
jgi:hypothetical protein